MHMPDIPKQEDSIDPNFFEKVDSPAIPLPALSLLTWNRFDLAFRLFYLDYRHKLPLLADTIYQEVIRVVTQDTFKEPDNPEKNSYSLYVEYFEQLADEIKANGMNPAISLVPLSKTGTIINGAHRVAASIHAHQTVYAVQTQEPKMMCDYRLFFKSMVSPEVLDRVAKTFITYSPNTYLAFLWPSGKANVKKSLEVFDYIVYQKTIRFTARGAFNLLVELYKHADWSGDIHNGYAGINIKLVECFPTLDDVVIVAFQADSLEAVRQIKARIRAIHHIGFSSVHITDTQEEAIRLSKLLFNENGLHFLNYADPFKHTPWEALTDLKKQLTEQHINPADVLIDGSSLLALYGIRDSGDLDLLSADPTFIPTAETELHDTELKYHKQDKATLLYDDRFYLEYDGLKFVSFNQLYAMKTTRNDEKDRVDIQRMKALVEKNSWKRLGIQLKQTVFYIGLKSSNQYRKHRKQVRRSIIAFLHWAGLHTTVKRWIVRD